MNLTMQLDLWMSASHSHASHMPCTVTLTAAYHAAHPQLPAHATRLLCVSSHELAAVQLGLGVITGTSQLKARIGWPMPPCAMQQLYSGKKFKNESLEAWNSCVTVGI